MNRGFKLTPGSVPPDAPGTISGVLNSPDWDKKSDVEKARARVDFCPQGFRRQSHQALQAVATLKQQGNMTGAQKIVDRHQRQTGSGFPEWRSRRRAGYIGGNDVGGAPQQEVPMRISDVATEQAIEAAKKDPKALDALYDKWDQSTDPGEKSALQHVLAGRFGDKSGVPFPYDLEIGGAIPKPDKSLLHAFGPTGTRVAGSLAAMAAAPEALALAPETFGGSLVAPFSINAAAEAAAQTEEKGFGQRQSYSLPEGAINAVVGMVPAPDTEGFTLAQRVARMGAQGAVVVSGSNVGDGGVAVRMTRRRSVEARVPTSALALRWGDRPVVQRGAGHPCAQVRPAMEQARGEQDAG